MMGGFTVITTMKNEGAFLIEWVAHHKALGFDRIVICTNDCADPTARMAARLQEMGLARHHATKVWPSTSIQRSALKQVTRLEEVQEAEWLYVCDADEFLTIRAGDGGIRALVAAGSAEVEVISVPWRIFGPDGRLRHEDQPVTAQFRRAALTVADLVAGAAELPDGRPKVYCKSVFRGLGNLHRIGVHAPVPRADLGRALRRELPGGSPWPTGMNPMFSPPDYRVAQVNHYALRARDSFLVKRDRGRVNHSDQVMQIDYWDRFDHASQPCDAIRRYDAPVANWRAELLADPVLGRLHRRAARWHQQRAAQLLADPQNAPLLEALAARGY